ncbi:MAG TPA: hypothetical protein VID73_06330 [Ktedonobacterales bacterium]|jgi:hypothetical protein
MGEQQRTGGAASSFDAQFAPHNREVFRAAASRELAAGADALERAREYAARGKPEFVLAYLLAATAPDSAKRALYADTFDARAARTEQRAEEFDQRFHRPFPLLRLEAAKDRATAVRIRSGGSLRPGLGRPLPTL